MMISNATRPKGFALVTALSLMGFVLLLILSITSLAEIEIRSAQASKAHILAKQNALIGLKSAISNLQKLAGPDTRITATAESIATANGPRNITGVWRSWEGSDHYDSGDFIGQAIAPNYASKLQSGQLEPEATSSGRFLGWLCSDALSNNNPKDPPDLSQVLATTVPLLTSEQENSANEVHVNPTPIHDAGHFAWWISGENSKAQLKHQAKPATTDKSAKRISTFGVADAEVFNLTADAGLNIINSLGAYNLLSKIDSANTPLNPSDQYRHDLTAWSRGLLTNAATGGWKRDLSLMSEDWNALPATGLPFFTLKPGVETSARKASANLTDAQQLIYPWANSSDKTPDGRGFVSSPSASWAALQDFCMQYRMISNSSANGQVTLPAVAYGTTEVASLRRDKIQRHPVVARLHWVFSYAATEDPAFTNANIQYTACIDMSPVITLWNPYNVELTIDPIKARLRANWPMKFNLRVLRDSLGTTDDFDNIEMRDLVNASKLEMRLNGSGSNNTITLQPGETRVFTAQTASPTTGSSLVQLYPGYRNGGGFRYHLRHNGQAIQGAAADRFYTTVELSYYGLQFDMVDNANKQLCYHYAKTNSLDPFPLTQPAPSDGPGESLKLENLKDFPIPFLATACSIASLTILDGNRGGKGLLRLNPLKVNTNTVMQRDPFYKWDYYALNGYNGPGFPESKGDHSYIGMGLGAYDGLTHLIAAELPVQPLQSLAELQHFDITHTNPTHPYAFNAIANSHAYGSFQSSEVKIINNQVHPKKKPYCLDHSYLANHLLFDDWFVSSIAPETSAWSSNISRSHLEVYQEHLQQIAPLPNHAYRPSMPAASSSEAESRANTDLDPATAWREIGSKLEVEGMFNVNSTSIPAWTAILRNLRSADVPTVKYSASAWELELDAENQDLTPIGRSRVSGSDDSQTLGNSPKQGSHTKLSDQQIDALAVEIVEQVKLRGPFLSLSEFVNRQLSNNSDLALAGAIEAALLKLSSRGGNDNPNKKMQSHFPEQVSNSWINRGSNNKDQFKAASEGYAAYGLPGWLRQADILRSLAPILSVRDDSFVIRSYGDTQDPITGKTLDRAWCEAVVQRKAEYVDSQSDNSTTLPSSATLNSDANARFGRQFEIVSFRWLSADEI